MQDREKISTGPNAEAIDENIAGHRPWHSRRRACAR